VREQASAGERGAVFIVRERMIEPIPHAGLLIHVSMAMREPPMQRIGLLIGSIKQNDNFRRSTNHGVKEGCLSNYIYHDDDDDAKVTHQSRLSSAGADYENYYGCCCIERTATGTGTAPADGRRNGRH
jgi:hypothetical protein